ncbi:Transmembrane protein like [Quillaja saponaria]|uniref:Transmembrane protein like n=1 Tax=Quillaja saponaria TaxID=32244 RepID=A0AAD7LJY4_QUISA|nr:Transmembrane protein like [Quillaja saponaria]
MVYSGFSGLFNTGKIQFNCIIPVTAAIGLGMCEMALWNFEYANFNPMGSRPMGITLWTVTFTAVKKTVSRLLLLVFSMGYGVVLPKLGGITSKKLQIRRSMAKLELYRKFTNSLAVTVLLSVAWIGDELYFNASDPLSELRRRAWIIPAFWTLLAYLLLVVICALLAPSQNPTRYAYSEVDDFDEDGISLTGSRVKVAGDLATIVERKERKAATAADHIVFGLAVDLEEDKRNDSPIFFCIQFKIRIYQYLRGKLAFDSFVYLFVTIVERPERNRRNHCLQEEGATMIDHAPPNTKGNLFLE